MEFDEALEYAARELRHGSTRPRVRRELVDEGIHPEQASEILTQVERELASQRKAGAAKAGRWKMLLGAALMALGVGTTVWSYLAAGPGGWFAISLGPTGLGAYLLFSGKMRV